MTSFSNKTAIITGASRGIGEATARHMAKLGANVVLAARTESDVWRIAREIRAAGGNAMAQTCDVSRYDDVALLVEAAVEAYGKLDIYVNNAGIIDPIARIGDSNPQAWSDVVDINYKGVYFGLRVAIPIMLTQGGGTIINVSSGAATSALEGWSHYCSTKAAVLSLTRCAHREYGDRGINVVGISPGTVTTQVQVTIRESGINPVSQLPASAHIPPEWVARGIEFLCGVGGSEFAGGDFSLKTTEGRAKAGLPPLDVAG